MKMTDLLQEWRHVLETLDLIVEPRIEDLKVSHVTDTGCVGSLFLIRALC